MLLLKVAEALGVVVRHHSLLMLGESVEITATLTQDFGPEPGEKLFVRPGTGPKSRQEHDWDNDNSLMRISYRRYEACS